MTWDDYTPCSLSLKLRTLVRGRMESATDRGMVGTSGTMTFGIHFVTAVDGQKIHVIANTTRAGRDRGNALVGWTIAWGVFGLMTKGVNPYFERGATFDVQVLADKRVDTEKPIASDDQALPLAAHQVQFLRYKVADSSSKPFKLDIERGGKLKTIEFQLQWPAELGAAQPSLATLELVAVAGAPVPERQSALSATAKSVTFDSWSILQYCRDGVSELRFRGTTPAGEAFDVTYPLEIKIVKKK